MCAAETGTRRGTRRLGLLLALVLTGVLFPLSRAEAFPIAPRTLWDLTKQAELVVWADVEEVTALPPAESREEEQHRDRWDDGEVAHLRIRETWRGKALPGEQIDVRFNGSYICPAPPRYTPGLAVIAFLMRVDGHWRTIALSYGTRYPKNADALAAYRRAVTRVRVVEEQALVARAAGSETGVMAALTDWQVLVAEHPATRWDGLYGLVHASGESLPAYDSRRPLPIHPFLTHQEQLARAFSMRPHPAHLFPAHREQLARAFVEAPSEDPFLLPMMLTVLRGHASAEVDDMAARALEPVLSMERPPSWARSAFGLLRERYGEPPTDAAAMDAPPLLQQWQHFKQRHRLEPKPPST